MATMILGEEGRVPLTHKAMKILSTVTTVVVVSIIWSMTVLGKKIKLLFGSWRKRSEDGQHIRNDIEINTLPLQPLPAMFAPETGPPYDPRRAKMQYNFLRKFADEADAAKLPPPVFTTSRELASAQDDIHPQAPYFFGGGLRGNNYDAEPTEERNSEHLSPPNSPQITAVAHDEEDVGSLTFPLSPTIAQHPYNTVQRPYRGGHKRRPAIDVNDSEDILQPNLSQQMTIVPADDEQEPGPAYPSTSAPLPRRPAAHMGNEVDRDSDDLEALNAYLDQISDRNTTRSLGQRLSFPVAHMRISASEDTYDPDAFTYFDQLSDDGMEETSGPHKPEGQGKGKEKEAPYPLEPAPTMPPQAYFNKYGSYRWL